MRSFVVAKVLIINGKGQVLALRRSQTDDRRPGQWDFPGGWVDLGEDVRTAAIREVKEEAGIDIASPELIFAFSEMITPSKTLGSRHGSGTWLLFIEHVAGNPKISLSTEHDAHAWKNPDQLLKEITYDRQQKMLHYVLDNKLLD